MTYVEWQLEKYDLKRYLLPIVLIMAMGLNSCSGETSMFPDELRLPNPTYEASVMPWMGPAGISKEFKVYKLNAKIADLLLQNGDALFQDMRSISEKHLDKDYRDGGPRWVGFGNWMSTPIQRDKKWRNRPHERFDGPFLEISEFYGDVRRRKFVDTIDIEHLNDFHDTIRGTDGFYSYGGLLGRGLLVLSPKHRKAFYLFRD